MNTADRDAERPKTERNTDPLYGTWDLIRLASDIKKSYRDQPEERQDDLDAIAEILSFPF
jgi:hypothetical protein